MGSWNLGSVSTELFNMIPNIPTTISGLTLDGMVDRRRFYMEDYTGQTIGSTGISTTFQPALVNLTAADLLRLIHLRGGDMSIGDVRVGRSALEAANSYQEIGMKELQNLGRKSRFYKALG